MNIMAHGGKRLNAGRKPRAIPDAHVGPEVAGRIMERINFEESVVTAFNDGNGIAKAQILRWLAEQRWGKAAQQKEQPKTEKDERARVVVQFWEDADISKPAQMGPVNENVTVRESDTHDGSSGELGSSLGPSKVQ